MSDPGTRAADQAAKIIAKRIKTIYAKAQAEIREEIAEFTKQFAANDAVMQQKLADGLITKSQYDYWKKYTVFRGKDWEAKAAHCAKQMTNANAAALDIVRGEQIGVFAENMSYQAYELEAGLGAELGFHVYDSHAASNLLKNQPELLPRKIIDGVRDQAWNREIIANEITKSIIKGDSISTIADSLSEALGRHNDNAMNRYARTAMTSAQNSGRMEMLREANEEGIHTLKKWLATLDDRTRDAHSDLDGETAEIDEPFHADLGPDRNGDIMYPGDPNADPANVYNCRCTLTYVVEGYENESGQRRDQETGELVDGSMTYQEWKDAKTAVPDLPAAAEATPEITPEPAADNLSKATRAAIEDYTYGEEFHLEQGQFDEIKENMQTTTEPMYRVETRYRTAEDNELDIGDRFDFSQQVFESKDEDGGALRSFTRSEDALPDLVGQTDDAFIYRTNGPVDQLPVDQYSQYDQAESLTFANGWEVTGYDSIEIDGHEYQVIDIRQAEQFAQPTEAAAPEPERDPASVSFEEVMEKANALPQSGEWEDDKVNLVPMADEEFRKEAHDLYQSIPESQRDALEKEATVEIADLVTEQDEVFIPRIEEMAEAFDGREVSGARTEDHDGILVGSYKGQMMILDGNNRTNLAILKGQTELEVMVVDLDDWKRRKGR